MVLLTRVGLFVAMALRAANSSAALKATRPNAYMWLSQVEKMSQVANHFPVLAPDLCRARPQLFGGAKIIRKQ
jgi:hypothetical protein